jgi:hypothetical protein
MVPLRYSSAMPRASLQVAITDLSGRPLVGAVRISCKSGSGLWQAEFPDSGATDFTVSGLPRGLGQFTIHTRHYRTYSFFQMLPSPAADVRLAIRPSHVRGIAAPPLPPELAAVLPDITPFDNLDPLHQACLLNIYAKASDDTSGNTFRFVRSVVKLEQDRVFCTVDAGLAAFLTGHARYSAAPGTLHKPLPGYQLRQSFKSRDAHANIQFTLMQHRTSGDWAADIDIDEASGIRHGMEVLRNAVTGGKTNPYQVHQLLLLTGVDPGYHLLLPGAA